MKKTKLLLQFRNASANASSAPSSLLSRSLRVQSAKLLSSRILRYSTSQYQQLLSKFQDLKQKNEQLQKDELKSESVQQVKEHANQFVSEAAKNLVAQLESAAAREFQNAEAALQKVAQAAPESGESSEENDNVIALSEKVETNALETLARLYETGVLPESVIPKDLETAFRYYLQAAQYGSSTAQYKVGLMYLKGYDILICNDFDEGYNVPEVSYFDQIYSNFVRDDVTGGVSYKDPKAVKRLEAKQVSKARKQKYAEAEHRIVSEQLPGLSELVSSMKLKENVKIAFMWLEKAAQSGNTKAIAALGNLHTNSQHSASDFRTGFKYLNQAAELNDPTSLFSVGSYYYSGLSLPGSTGGCNPIEPIEIPENIPKAIELFEKSASLGFSGAQYWLGHAYHQGNDVPQNTTKALEYLHAAIAQGHSAAAYYLARMYRSGDRVPKDLAKWHQYFRKAIDLNDPEALFTLADFYYHGNAEEGYQVDKQRALELYMKAGKAGSADAFYCLGVIYYHGEPGVCAQDFHKSYNCYAQSMSLGSDRAIVNVASMLIKGEGVLQDKRQGEYLLKVAAMQNQQQQ